LRTKKTLARSESARRIEELVSPFLDSGDAGELLYQRGRRGGKKKAALITNREGKRGVLAVRSHAIVVPLRNNVFSLVKKGRRRRVCTAKKYGTKR